mgnify:CR=1 FL=1
MGDFYMKITVLNLKGLIHATKSCVVVCLAVAVFCLSVRIAVVKRGGEYVAVDATPTPPVFVIDAGHGGEDPGAIGVNGVYEKDINLAIANEIGAQLTEKGYTVIYTRTEDKMLYSEDENIKGFRKLSDLKNRLKIANESGGAILISVHMNSYGEEKYSGLQGYYKPSCEESRNLAAAIQSRVINEVQPQNNRTVKKGNNIYMLEKYDGVGVLIECGFLTNSAECEKLCEKEYQKQLSFSIVCGIIEYMK